MVWLYGDHVEMESSVISNIYCFKVFSHHLLSLLSHLSHIAKKHLIHFKLISP